MSAWLSPTWGRAGAVFSIFTAITGFLLIVPPVSGSVRFSGSGESVGAGSGAAEFSGEVLLIGAEEPDGRSSVTATPIPIPVPARTAVVAAAAIVCARLRALVLMGKEDLLQRGWGRDCAAAQAMAPGRPWHILYFLPEPHGHGAFRPTPAYGSSALLGLPAVFTDPSSSGAE